MWITASVFSSAPRSAAARRYEELWLEARKRSRLPPPPAGAW